MTDPTTTAVWRRLDVPGHDACRLEPVIGGWRLAGTAVFRGEDGEPTLLAYEVECDAAWRTRRGAVRGWIGARRVERLTERGADGGWTLDGAPVAGLDGCVDLDLGFTPATNRLQLERLSLAVGRAATFDVAWLDADSETLVALPQRYERRGERAYWYESPTADYEALLELSPSGFTRHYPTLWVAEA